MDSPQDTQDNDHSGILNKSITSGKWLTFGYTFQKLIGFFSFFILARILSPADFGILAIVLLIPRILEATTETGFAAAAIQKKGDIRAYLNPIWTISVLKSFVIFILVFLFGPAIARYYHAEEAELAIRLGGLFIVAYNFTNVGEIYFWKDIFFKKVVIRNTLKELSYVLVAVPLALAFRSFWALLAGTMASYMVQTISTYFLHPYRPRLTLNMRPLKDLFGYSRWVVGQGWIEHIFGFLEQTLVARLTTIRDVGLYSKAKNMASVPPGFLSPILSTVGFSAYSKLIHDPDKLRDGVRKSFDLLFFFLIPITALVIAAGGKLILLFLGNEWLAMTNAVRFFLLFYLLSSIVDICYALLNGIGQPDKKVRFDLMRSIFTIALIAILTPRYGITGTAAAIFIGVIPIIGLVLNATARQKLIGYKDIISTAWIPLSSCLFAFLPVLIFKERILSAPLASQIAAAAFLAGLYLALIFLFGTVWNRGPYKTIRVVLKHLR